MATTPAKKPWFLSKEKTSGNSGFWTSRKSSYSSSNYWLKDSIFERQTTILDRETTVDSSPKIDYYQLAKYQRAISNFVRIMTGRNDIRVKYAERGKESYTDGKTITLSTNIKDGEFDAAVGLALHESSHIIYTDFSKWQQYVETAKLNSLNTANYKKILLNIVEDLYIDAMTYKTSPGYRGYYSALYQKFFGDAKIVRGMYSPDYMIPTWDTYIFHITNIRNPQRNLKALPGLEEMFKLLDIQNITRLGSFKKRTELADKLFTEIEKYATAFEEFASAMRGKGGDEKSDAQSSGSGSGSGDGAVTSEELNEWLESLSDEDIENMTQGEDSNNDGDSSKEEDSDEGENSSGTNKEEFVSSNGVEIEKELKESFSIKPEELSASAREALKKIIAKQRDFVNGKPQKTGANREVVLRVDAMASVDADQRIVGADGIFSKKGITLTVINRINDRFIQDIGSLYGISSVSESSRKNLIEVGINRGRMLARKLQIRNEERVNKTTRLNSGKIDKRLLHEIGFENYDIFSKINITSYTPSYIHISIDQSGSMSGDLINSAVQLAAMFATASKYIENIHLQVSIRSTVESTGKSLPYLVYIFDSKLDSIQTIRNIFPRIHANGLTPEGLAFEGIQREIAMKSRNTEAYFINICDGEPYMIYDNNFRYAYHEAQEHCRRQMTKMEKEGIKFITYYIGSSFGFKAVEHCYGKNAYLLSSATEIGSIAKSMNKKLL